MWKSCNGVFFNSVSAAGSAKLRVWKVLVIVGSSESDPVELVIFLMVEKRCLLSIVNLIRFRLMYNFQLNN